MIKEKEIIDNFTNNYRKYHSYVYSRIQTTSDIDDIISGVFERILHNRDKISLKGNLNQYIFTSLRNAIIDIFRKNKYELLDEAKLLRKVKDDINFYDINNAIENDSLTFINNIINKIKNKDIKNAFVDFAIYGNSYKEISQKYGVPVNTIAARIRYARKEIIKLGGKQLRDLKFVS